MIMKWKNIFNPVLFMSLFGHALFTYNPPKRSREVWWFFELMGITLEHMKTTGLTHPLFSMHGSVCSALCVFECTLIHIGHLGEARFWEWFYLSQLVLLTVGLPFSRGDHYNLLPFVIKKKHLPGVAMSSYPDFPKTWNFSTPAFVSNFTVFLSSFDIISEFLFLNHFE